MQLNKTHKRHIVAAIMADIPEIDYKTQTRDYVQAEALKLMPPEIVAIYNTPELRRYLQCLTLSVSGEYIGHVGSIFWCRTGDEAYSYSPTLYPLKPHWNDSCNELTKGLMSKVRDQVDTFRRLADKQGVARRSMRDKLDTMLQGIRTLKQAKTLLEPELHKYLPEPPPKVDRAAAQASVALVPYMVSSLKEMGWPKDQEPTTEESA